MTATKPRLHRWRREIDQARETTGTHVCIVAESGRDFQPEGKEKETQVQTGDCSPRSGTCG